MDKVLVLGALEELGFQLTSSLLEEGYEVRGILHQKEEDALYDERRLRIGRNANFEEIHLIDWLEEEVQEEAKYKTIFFINYLDDKDRISHLEKKLGKRIIDKLQSIMDPGKSSIISIQSFSDWEKRNSILPIKSGKVIHFFVPKIKEEHLERTENDYFDSIFKAIIELCM